MSPSKKALAPGDYVQAPCTRCKEVLRHTIVALVDGRPARVKCNTCEGEHVYRAPSEAADAPPAAAKAPRAAASKSSKGSAKAATLEAEWAAQLAATGSRARREYSPKEAFRSGEVMEHPSFGAGIVQRVLEAGKILVLFSTGAKILVCRKA